MPAVRITAAILALVAVAPPGAALAQRTATVDLSCAQARGVVARAGGIVLGTGGPTYDRFVSNRSYCQPTEFTKAAFAPTRNDPRCFIGYTCFEPGTSDRPGDY